MRLIIVSVALLLLMPSFAPGQTAAMAAYPFPDLLEYRKCMDKEQQEEMERAYSSRLLSREVGPHQPPIYKDQHDGAIFKPRLDQSMTEELVGFTCWANREGHGEDAERPDKSRIWYRCPNSMDCNSFGYVAFGEYYRAAWDQDSTPGRSDFPPRLSKADSMAAWVNFGDKGMYGRITFYYVMSPNPIYKTNRK